MKSCPIDMFRHPCDEDHRAVVPVLLELVAKRFYSMRADPCVNERELKILF